jgi:tRNA(Ile)-lysidine synthase
LQACSDEGILHLLLGHHQGDQAETLMMRALSSSAARGLAGMAALVETRSVRLLRPQLDFPPHRLRSYLTERGVCWVEDPSNRDPHALRARLRAARDDLGETPESTEAIARATRTAGTHRAKLDQSVAATLARRVSILPEGYAILSPGPIEPEALAALFRTIGGAAYTPPIDQIAPLARDPVPATLGGVRIAPAGRLGPGWLLIRENRAVSPAVGVVPNVIWDGRFRLTGRPPDVGAEFMLGALGADATRFGSRKGLPALILQVLPAVRSGTTIVAVPHIGVGDSRWTLTFDPRNPASSAPFHNP